MSCSMRASMPPICARTVVVSRAPPASAAALSKLSDIGTRMPLRYCVDSYGFRLEFRRQSLRMLYPIMLLGIGFLTACLLMAMLAPLIHERAVRLTVRRLSRRGRSVIDRRAHEDQLRAQFAVTTLRLETAMRDTQAKAASHLCDVAKRSAETH